MYDCSDVCYAYEVVSFGLMVSVFYQEWFVFFVVCIATATYLCWSCWVISFQYFIMISPSSCSYIDPASATNPQIPGLLLLHAQHVLVLGFNSWLCFFICFISVFDRCAAL